MLTLEEELCLLPQCQSRNILTIKAVILLIMQIENEQLGSF